MPLPRFETEDDFKEWYLQLGTAEKRSAALKEWTERQIQYQFRPRKRIVQLSQTVLRLLQKPSRYQYTSKGYCPACDQKGLFICHQDDKVANANYISTWNLSRQFKEELVERENHFCCLCHASFRIRAHARTVLNLLGHDSSRRLITTLAENSNFRVYETAAYNLFRIPRLTTLPNYVVSEYRKDVPFGSHKDGVRNETLESLSFPDNTFDVVMNSDVLEHVGDLDRALSEIRRVLKPGGYHIFTVPVDHELARTLERARIVGGNVQYLLAPVFHGDSIRTEGILAFRDFGADVLTCLSRENMVCQEMRHSLGGRFVTSVYYARKT